MTQLRRRHRLVVVNVAAITVGIVAGCHSHPTSVPAPATGPAPERDHIILRWVDNPSVDLMSPEGTFVRAWLESYGQLGFGGGNGKAMLANGYPGFAHAFNNVSDLSNVSANIPFGPGILVGTRYEEVVSLRREGEKYTVHTCEYNSLLAIKVGDRFESSGTDPSYAGELLTFGPDPALAPADQRPPKANQKGPAATPSDNVFGTWVATHYEFGNDLNTPCNKLAPGTPAEWPRGHYVTSTPPPVLPPSPGWPAGGSA